MFRNAGLLEGCLEKVGVAHVSKATGYVSVLLQFRK